MSLLK
jgi:hypothetical protein